jgi:hypothetical protein
MSAPRVPEGVLILSNDFLTPFAKTSDYLADAFERRGIPAYVRDNAEARMLTFLCSDEMAPKLPLAQAAVIAAQRELIERAAIDTVRHARPPGRRPGDPGDPLVLVRRFSQLGDVAVQSLLPG